MLATPVSTLARRAGRESLLLAATVALSWGTMFNFGALTGRSMVSILVALGLAALALSAPARGPGARTLSWWAAVTITAAAGLLYATRFGVWVELLLAAALIITCSAIVTARHRRLVAAAAVAAVASLAAMTAVAWQWGASDIDVFDGLQKASNSLLHGWNPYTDTFQALYQPAPTAFRAHAIHFDYLPGAVLLAAPGRLLGDTRVMSVIAFMALVTFTVLLASASPGGDARRPSKVLALTLALPLTVAMIHWAWLDVYSMTGLAGWLALRARHRRWSVALLVLAFVVKPTILIALVPIGLWSGRARHEILGAAGIAVVIMVPFVLMTGPAAFYDDVAGIYISLEFRYDGLTLSAWWYQLTGALLPVWFTLAVGTTSAYLCLRRRPTDLSDMLIMGAVLSTTVFLVAKQAFLNYYFIPIWLIVLALAARGIDFEAEENIGLPWHLPIPTGQRSRAAQLDAAG